VTGERVWLPDDPPVVPRPRPVVVEAICGCVVQQTGPDRVTVRLSACDLHDVGDVVEVES